MYDHLSSVQVIHFTGYLIINHPSTDYKLEEKMTNGGTSPSIDNSFSLVLIGAPIPNPSDGQALLPNHTFVTKHSLDMRITFVDEK